MAMRAMREDRVSYPSGDGQTSVPAYIAAPDGPGPHPAVLILRGSPVPKRVISRLQNGWPAGVTSPSCTAGRFAATIRRTHAWNRTWPARCNFCAPLPRWIALVWQCSDIAAVECMP